jgi:molecular chaperone GrpE
MSEAEKKPEADESPPEGGGPEVPDVDPVEEAVGANPEERIEELEKENAELLDRLMRTAAEFDNYRKRIAREQAGWADRAREGFALDLLPVQDSFDRAIESAGDAKDAAAVLEGMKLVRRQLVAALKRHGVEPIEALGEPFDPNLHEAFGSRPVEEGEDPGTIVLEVERGYVMGDRTIRATKGIVAVAPEEETGSRETREEE